MAIFLIFISFGLIIVLFIRQANLKQEIEYQKSTIFWLLGEQKSRSAQESSKAETAIQANPITEATQAPPIKDTEQAQAAAQAAVPKAQMAESQIMQEKVVTEQAYVPAACVGCGQEVNVSGYGGESKNPVYCSACFVAAPAPVKRKSFFQNEDWVGISLFNRLGALLIIIGTIAVAAFEGFPTILRTSILFAFAFAVIVLGEWLNRKKPNIVSLGVSATGVALVYVAIAASFFALETLGMYTALLACIAATALGIYLASRYKAQVIGCFALVGGYLPIFALDPLNNPMMAGVMVYFVLLSLFSLILALRRKWPIMNIIGFTLTVAGASYLGFQANPGLALAYACFAFLLYTALPLIAARRTKENFSELDVWLILLNTCISSLLIFLIANRLDIPNLHAYLSLSFAVIYGGMAILVKRIFSHKNMPVIFTLTSIAFFVLFVPFYFAIRWFAIAWLVQGFVLASYGILQSKKIAEYSGLGILGLSITPLLTSNFVLQTVRSGGSLVEIDLFAAPAWQFTLDYTFFTIVALAILVCYFIKGRQQWVHEKAYKLFAFANLWIFVLYIIIRYVLDRFDNAILTYLVSTSGVMATFALAYLYCKIKFWADNGTRILANVIHFAGMLGLWASSIVFGILGGDGDNVRLMINLVTAIIGFALVLYYHLSEKRNGWTIAYKNINIVSLWLLFLWCFGIVIRDFFAVQMILIACTFAAAFVITRISAIADRGTHVMAIVIHIIGLVWLWVFNSWPYSNIGGLMAFNGLIQIAALAALFEVINLCGAKGKLHSLKIVILSAYFLLTVTQAMMVQGNVAFNSALISIMYALAAFAWIIVGFRLKNRPTRKAGLFLSMAAVAKLLIIDTWGLSTEMRIISYISLGLILMLISFVYQRLSKRMEN